MKFYNVLTVIEELESLGLDLGHLDGLFHFGLTVDYRKCVLIRGKLFLSIELCVD